MTLKIKLNLYMCSSVVEYTPIMNKLYIQNDYLETDTFEDINSCVRINIFMQTVYKQISRIQIFLYIKT